LEEFIKEILSNYENIKEFKRLFFGRGKVFEFDFLNVDLIDSFIYAEFFKETKFEKEIIKFLENFAKEKNKDLLIKKRYSNEILGEIKKVYAIEENIKFILDFTKQNIGYFGDMKNARKFIKEISQKKSVINLFAYTCGFSMFSRIGGAKRIINVDINQSVLKAGLKNHQINNINTKNISFLKRDVLKTLKKLPKSDIIIIDPPSKQSSFSIFKDYQKLIKNLPYILKENSIILAAANHPDFSRSDLIEIFKDYKLLKEILPPKEYKGSSLKCLIFNL